MLHSYTKILVHLIRATLHREKTLVREIRLPLKNHFLEYARAHEIMLKAINVQIDHVHALIDLQSTQKIEEIVKLLKGESSHWINAQHLVHGKFSWQRGYGAFSISPAHSKSVEEYISVQDEHHKTKTFADEYKNILQKYGFSLLETDESVEE